MIDNKWSERTEEHIVRKIKSCLPEVEKTFQESTEINDKPKHSILYTEKRWSNYFLDMVFPKKLLQL